MAVSQINELFGAAFFYCLEKAKRGVQAKIAADTGVDPSMLSAMKRRGKGSSEDVRRTVFAKLLELSPKLPTKNYEEFLSLGQWIIDGKNPGEWSSSKKASVSATQEFLGPSGSSKKIPQSIDDLISIVYFPDIYGACGYGAINYNAAREVMKFDREFLIAQFGVQQYANVHIIHAVGDSMETNIHAGDLLFVNPGETEIRTGADFYAKDVDGLKKEGATSLEVLLDMCKEDGVEPRKEYSGKFNLRLSPRLHEEISTAAAAEGKSLNQWVTETLDRAVQA